MGLAVTGDYVFPTRSQLDEGIFIVSALRSPPGLDPKRVHFWCSFSSGSEKGPLLELIFGLGELFGVILGSFFNP